MFKQEIIQCPTCKGSIGSIDDAYEHNICRTCNGYCTIVKTSYIGNDIMTKEELIKLTNGVINRIKNEENK